MGLIGFIQVFNIIIIAIGTLLYMCCRSLTFSSSSSAADSDVSAADSAVDSTVVAADDAADIPRRREKYDVFISFRGEDTRNTFTSHLHAALQQKNIETYIDNRLKRGEAIGPALLKAIKKSTLWVIIFSQKYASSTWCLEELVHILKCNDRGQSVIPIFYHTHASDVRKQKGSYEVAFAEHQKRVKDSIDKVPEWKEALTNAANIAGFHHSENTGTDADLVKKVVEHIWTKLCRESSCNLKGLVGIESRIEQIESLLGIHSTDACITVGIWGMGGIGKTTLAQAVFHKLSSKFKGGCFLVNVREREQKDGLEHLQNTLVREIFKEQNLSIGSTLVRDRLSHTKVLIVLDDVSSSMQMESLAGERLQYGTGSRIIITSRDKGTLRQTVEEEKIYEVKGLNPDDALELFCLFAFKNNSTCRTDYKELVEKAVHYAGHVPLALIVLGSLFFNRKSKEDWEDEFNKLKRFPSVDIQKVLRISYDGLGENEKEIFLDIACFHKGGYVDVVKRMLDVRGFFAKTGITILIDLSLISKDSKWGRETIEMHDLLQEMGRTIVQEQCSEDPGKRKRLFTDEDVYRVLKSNTETPIVQAILVDWHKIEERSLKRADFKVMSNLKMLIVDNFQIFDHNRDCKLNMSLDLPDSLRYIYWPEYPLESLSANFSPENLVELHMPYSRVKKLWKEDQRLVNLEVIDVAWSKNLIEVPNLSRSPKIVHIDLPGCDKLVEIPRYFRDLDKLIHIDLGHCTSLKYLSEMAGNIKYLNLEGSGIKELPESVWSNEHISYLDISHCKDLQKLPSNKCNLKVSGCFKVDGCTSLGEFSELPRDISKLSLVGCKRLVSLPTNICKLKCLEELNLSECSKLQNFPEILEPMEHLKSLNLSSTAIEELHSSIEFFPALKRLTLSHCQRLSSIPKSICKLKYLEKLNLSCCSKLENFPEILEPMKHLEYLNLSETSVQELHSSIEFLPALKNIELKGCKRLSSIPKSICKLKYLEELDLSYCYELESFPEILEPMEHLKSLNLRGTAVRELHSSIKFLHALKRIELQGCKRLSSIPKSICKLKYLEELDLSYCYELENFPEILEPMEHLEFLNLSGTAVEELHSSIEFLSALKEIRLRDCRRLSSIPKSICKLKYLEELDLSCCSKLENFPEILEPMKHLKSLNLSATMVKELHSSIKFLPALKKVKLRGCERLSSIPKSICKLKYLEGLDLSRCFELENFPEILEPMEHLGSLNLSGTTVEELHSSIEFLPALKEIRLGDCKRLSSIPKSICKLKYLEELNLSCCSKLENFPVIFEPMEHLKSLNLRGTAIKELHSSIKFLPALKKIELEGCKRLSSIPSSICKLKYLEELNLSCCFELENFPEILEPMEHLKSLNLSGTAVKELPLSIEFLPALTYIQLCGCKRLSSIPTSICKLKYLKELDLSYCSELESFPEILEPMEHLGSLNLSGTTVEELHSSIEFLPALKEIRLRDCKRLSSIPKSICKLKYLEELDLSCCSQLENFPENLEPMEHLKSLNLSGTIVTELHSLIKFLPVLKRIQLRGCERLSSIPKNICKFKYLEELDLSYCSQLENFPEILEPMEHLKSLNFSGTAVKELHSLIKFLPALKRIQLRGCERLSSIPKSICKLKYLEELDLSCCSELENFPEIMEPMEHLKFLNLSGTAVQELHSSIKFLPALRRIQLRACQSLSIMPKNICKLKYLVELDLSYCFQLENFPEFLELMEHLKSLNLSGTAVKKLPSSIEFLLGLKIIQLQGCKRLSSIPKNICKLKYLEELNLSCCSELENFPEILEPMEHLKSLNLSGTAVKELPLSIEFLPALTYIQLCGCKKLSSIPKSICKLKYLKELDLSYCSELESFPEIMEPMEHLKFLNLSGTAVQELHSSIEFLLALKEIQLQDCKRLSSIPKSICKLKYLEKLDLSCCSKLENFPEILEPMEHLKSLNLSETTVKELHSSIEFLPALKEIRLGDCKRLPSSQEQIDDLIKAYNYHTKHL
ncbi:disease resistance protein RPV1-like isoform X7 [Malus sylvestris]|uniref:disease resistance protein RPV1-like isoform X7 n=1 Tax=Malus sylvestris TaxID=3752 RepID=UPI0021ABF183|nr:disease resistance protein RPV1-like isoform X7 [Malus sylvestris]